MADEFVIIVPARAGSSRLPNKPLAQINGKSLLERVLDLAQSSNAKATFIATDNKKIREHAEAIGATVIMTREDHISGLDRVAEAANILELPDETRILNLQGDEPFMPLAIINSLTSHLSKDLSIVTACVPLTDRKLLEDPNEVKVVEQGVLVAQKLQDYLQRHSEIDNKLSKNSDLKILTTENAEKFDQHLDLFYNSNVKSASVTLH